MKGVLTRKDFLAYLANGGNINFNKPIKLNRTQLSNLTKDQLAGRQVIIIDNKQGYLDGDGFWKPKTTANNKLIKLNKQQISNLTDNQKRGSEVIKINGKEGYLNGDGMWVPKKILNQ